MIKTLIPVVLMIMACAASASELPDPKVAQFFDAPPYVEGQETPGYAAHVYAEPTAGAKLRLFVFTPDGASDKARPAILLFHSGGWTRGRPEWLFGLARQFSTQGLVAIPVQYRLSGATATPADALTDACAAFRWVRRQAGALNIDPQRLIGWGASAGGQLAAATATAGCPGPDAAAGAANALILVSAGVDTEQSAQFGKLLGPNADARRYSPLAHIAPGAPPTLHVVGREDTVAPAANADAYCAKVHAVQGICEVVAYPGVGHLLTRKIDDQRSSLDPDPALERAAYVEQEDFLRRIGYLH